VDWLDRATRATILILIVGSFQLHLYNETMEYCSNELAVALAKKDETIRLFRANIVPDLQKAISGVSVVWFFQGATTNSALDLRSLVENDKAQPLE
jgi:hypothetical protein